MIISRFVAVGLTLSACGLPALAQGELSTPENITESQARPAYQPSWSSSQIAQIAMQMRGTWRTDEPIESMPNEMGETVPVYMTMSIAPVPVEGLTDTLYVETARSDEPWSPYRRAIFQLYPYKDRIRLRTYEMAVGDASEGIFNGMFAMPSWFPEISKDDLIATIDIDLTPTPGGFTGSSPYPYPTGVGGAVEMTSSVTLHGDSMTVADRGYDASGSIVWGAGADSAYVFVRSQGFIRVDQREDGMVILDYGGASGPIVKNGDRMHINYDGFLKDMHRFDSSYLRGTPFIFAYPPGGRAITGWGIGMEGFAEGGRRKLLIPGYLAYGANGNPRANIPADAPLYFNIHYVHVDLAQPAPAESPGDSAGEADPSPQD